MTNEIATNKTFQDKMFERVRDQMGDLLTDEELKKIVEQAIQKAFFESISINTGYGNTTQKPSLFIHLIQEELKVRVNSAVSEWLKANESVVKESIENVIKEGMLKGVIQALESRMSWPTQQLGEMLKQRGIFT
jgi:predicted regulator of amino acid metabolism with ACT domain